MATEILANGNTAAQSADQALAAGTSTMLVLKSSDGMPSTFAVAHVEDRA